MRYWVTPRHSLYIDNGLRGVCGDTIRTFIHLYDNRFARRPADRWKGVWYLGKEACVSGMFCDDHNIYDDNRFRRLSQSTGAGDGAIRFCAGGHVTHFNSMGYGFKRRTIYR